MRAPLVRDDFGQIGRGHVRGTLALAIELQRQTTEYRGDGLGMLGRAREQQVERRAPGVAQTVHVRLAALHLDRVDEADRCPDQPLFVRQRRRAPDA
mgnify:CR=1 FL=1